MPEPNKIPRAFADSGDKNSIPDSSGGLGFASWQEGFPAITGTPFAQGGVAPKRADFNGIFNALSAATVWAQQGGLYAYSNAVNYEVGNVVLYSSKMYICIAANGPGTSIKAPTDDTAWTALLLSSGGTISGAIVQSNNNTPTLRNSGTSGRVTIGGGTAYNSGAYLWLYGKDNSGGSFDLDANNGNAYSRLHGGADGTLWWGTSSNNKNIAFAGGGTYTGMFFSQTSGTYTAPYTGVYRITLKGGGGGGGGAITTGTRRGSGGGEGATNIFYANLTKNSAYAYTIGAGGAAGASDSTNTGTTGGANGGNTTISISGTTYTALGGVAGSASHTGAVGGLGGDISATPGISIPGANGMPGAYGDYFFAAHGGGHRGGRTGSTLYPGLMGGGGGGANPSQNATAGGDGYILIEYAS